jgi:hypothetical protein
MIIAKYATFEQMHGRKSSLLELTQQLGSFSRESVLWFCSIASLALKLWDGGGWDRANYDELVKDSFDTLRGDWYRFSASTSDPELVFHRRQLLLIMKLAIQYCSNTGIDILAGPRHHLGTILLMANDQFHFGLYPPPAGMQTNDRDKVSRVLAEFVPVTEYGGTQIENLIVRSHLLVTRYTQQLRGDPDFIDVATEYERQSGIRFADYEALTFGLFSKFSIVTVEDLSKNPGLSALQPENFYKTAIPRETISKFLAEFSLTSNDAVTRIQRAQERNRDFGANDFSVFRDKPLLIEAFGRLPTDIMFVIEKFATGPYWRVNSTDQATGDKLRRFWGAAFERYVNDQISEAARLSGADFFPDPRPANDPNVQLCDGLLLEGNALVLLEYKSSMFSARAKYGGNHIVLRNEIATKLVRDEATNRRKGVEQLALAIRQLFGNQGRQLISGLNLVNVTRVYPLLITLDDLGGCLLVSRLLNTYFAEFLNRAEFAPIEIRPLFCTDIESLEQVLPYADLRKVSGFLQYWYEHDDKLLATLLAHLPVGLPARRNRMLFAEWRRLSDEISMRLFPEETERAARERKE